MPTETAVVTLPIAFSTMWIIQTTDGGRACIPYGCYRGTSKTQFTVYAPSAPGTTYGVWWLAMGY